MVQTLPGVPVACPDLRVLALPPTSRAARGQLVAASASGLRRCRDGDRDGGRSSRSVPLPSPRAAARPTLRSHARLS